MLLRTHLSLSLVLWVTSCLGLATQGLCLPVKEGEKTVTVTEKNNGGKISLPRGEILIIELDAQPGTGYGWQVVRNQPEHLSHLGSEFRSAKVELPGAVEHQVLCFRAQASGSFILELHYLRPWEKNVQPAKTYHLDVHIE
jgi:inhibitor of cysteine peptidase